jgi:hypothetical protein
MATVRLLEQSRCALPCSKGLQRKSLGEVMKSKIQFVIFSLSLVLVSAPAIFGQHQHSHDGEAVAIGQTGMLRLAEPVRAGNVLLKSGMYHVRHVVDGDKHVIVFESVALPAGYREYSMVEKGEAVRLECRLEPAAKTTRNTKIVFGRNAAGERVIQEIQIAGENVKHILLNNAR